MAAATAAVDAYRNPGAAATIDDINDRYHELWAFYTGTWRYEPTMQRQRKEEPRLYRHTVLHWNLVRSIVRLYAQAVYIGDISTDGKPLADGTRGAIPIDPQVPGGRDGDAAKQLLAASGELYNMWQMRQFMSLRPKMAAILGDCLTELIDDVEHGKVMPSLIWPGYVTDLELDEVGNIQRYTLEYKVKSASREAYGEQLPAEDYLFRKEVDKGWFRYYRDGKPFDYPDIGPAVQPNIYGFVPAVWDRHEIGWGVRGIGAFEGMLQALKSLNSVFAAALDYQQKQFAMPIGVIGEVMPSGAAERRRLRREPGVTSDPPVEDIPPVTRGEIRERQPVMPMDAGGQFVIAELPIGQTVEMMEFWVKALRTEYPESNYAQEILEMTQVTSPGIERAMGPMINGVKDVRKGQDSGTVSLTRMGIAMIGERLERKDYDDITLGQSGELLLVARAARYKVFQVYNLGSYGKGLLDFTIADRPVIPETLRERAEYAGLLATLNDVFLLEVAGVPTEKAEEMLAGREERAQKQFDREARAFNRGDDEPPAKAEGDAEPAASGARQRETQAAGRQQPGAGAGGNQA